MKPDLKAIYSCLKAIPYTVKEANTVNTEYAQAFANQLGYAIDDYPKELASANKYGQIMDPSAHCRYYNATSLFCGYLYDYAYEAACEDEQYMRHHEFD